MQYEPTNGYFLWPSTLKDCVEKLPEVPAFGILRHEGHKFQASLEYVVKQGLKEKKKCNFLTTSSEDENNHLFASRPQHTQLQIKFFL